jgi:hypothetical protein
MTRDVYSDARRTYHIILLIGLAGLIGGCALTAARGVSFESVCVVFGGMCFTYAAYTLRDYGKKPPTDV